MFVPHQHKAMKNVKNKSLVEIVSKWARPVHGVKIRLVMGLKYTYCLHYEYKRVISFKVYFAKGQPASRCDTVENHLKRKCQNIGNPKSSYNASEVCYLNTS